MNRDARVVLGDVKQTAVEIARFVEGAGYSDEDLDIEKLCLVGQSHGILGEALDLESWNLLLPRHCTRKCCLRSNPVLQHHVNAFGHDLSLGLWGHTANADPAAEPPPQAGMPCPAHGIVQQDQETVGRFECKESALHPGDVFKLCNDGPI